MSEIGINPTRDFLITYLVDEYGCSNSKLCSLSDSIFFNDNQIFWTLDVRGDKVLLNGVHLVCKYLLLTWVTSSASSYMDLCFTYYI